MHAHVTLGKVCLLLSMHRVARISKERNREGERDFFQIKFRDKGTFLHCYALSHSIDFNRTMTLQNLIYPSNGERQINK